ncbi:UNVERIFIED_CONTAM: hypothetical protein Slati_2908800 [Sesamum latifolium]|uniref:Uncharacterized protein n=1 Tax=Sesamum latifolium TaxID=2727402 RepID=A0AAW2VEI1_9LAMI
MEGERLIPDWALSARKSVLMTHVGQDSWEMYKSSLLPRDQALLAPYSHIQVEKHLANFPGKDLPAQSCSKEHLLATREACQ